MSWRFVPYTFSHDYSVALFSFWKSTMRLYVSSEATYWHFWLHTALAFNERFYHFCTTSFKKMNKFYPKYFFPWPRVLLFLQWTEAKYYAMVVSPPNSFAQDHY